MKSSYITTGPRNSKIAPSTMEMADSMDHLLGNRESIEIRSGSEPASRCVSRPMSSGNDMNGPRIELTENLKQVLQDGQLCRSSDICDTDSCGEHDKLMSSLDRSSNPLFEKPSDVASIDDLVRLNVGGTVFVTQRSTLTQIPNTRLSSLSESDPNYNYHTKEWFFDRNPTLINSFLDFYRYKELHFPHTFCGPSIKKEMIFWQISESDISPCCWNRYREYEQQQKIFDHIDEAFESQTLAQYTQDEAEAVPLTKWDKIKKKIYIFMEEPTSSKAAKIWTTFFLLFVLTSIGILCIETVPKLRVPIEGRAEEYAEQHGYFPETTTTTTFINGTARREYNSIGMNTTNSTTPHKKQTQNRKIILMVTTVPHPALEHIDSFLTSFFTLEFVLRLIVCPNKVKFWKSIMNVIDILCVLPMWIKYVMQLYEINLDENLLPLFFFIMVLRVLRICRVLRLARHYTGVKILVLALKASLRELFMLLVFVFIVVLIFAVVIYYAEFFVEDTFGNIPEGYWWAIITLTTVGYGDMYPKSGMGYVVGALCALTGILATGLPVPIIANNFNLYYSHAALKEALGNRKPRRHSKPTDQLSIENIPESDKDSIIIKEASV